MEDGSRLEPKTRHQSVVTQILQQFDLEDTKDRYRTSTSHELEVAGSTGATGRLRKQLIRHMGSDVIRMNDRKWNDKFTQKLQDDFERQEARREASLAEEEVQRLQRLRLEGLVPHNETETVDRGRKQRKVSPGVRKKSPHKGRRSGSSSPSPTRGATTNSLPPHHTPLSKDIRTQMDVMNNHYGNRNRRSRSPQRLRSRYQDNGGSSFEVDGEEAPELPYDGDERPDRADDSLSSHSSAGLVSKRLPPEVYKLYQEERMDNLYALAEELVH